MSVIKAGTTVTTALVLEGNTDGDLIFKTGSAAVTAMSISASGVVSFPATTTIGTLYFGAGSATDPSISTTGDANTGIFFPAADTIAFTEGGVEAMRIDSSGRLLVGATASQSGLNKTIELSSSGISTSQPSYFVNSFVSAGNSVNTGYFTFQRSAGSTVGTNTLVASDDRLGMVRFSGANGTTYTAAAEIYAEVDGTPGATNDMPGRLIFATTSDGAGATTERARINAAGNFGLGVTPSAWSTYTAAQVQQLSLASFTNGDGRVSNNAFYDSGGNWKYINTRYAVQYLLDAANGVHAWYTAASGTAGNTITFTQVLAVEGSKSLALQGASPQSGTGITFPATQSASSNVNTLDDYEEGDWTPAGLNVTFSSAVGRYNKIGRQVTVWWEVTWPTTSNTDAARISGMPFTVASNTWSGGIAITNVGIADVLAFVHNGQTNIFHRNSSNDDYLNSSFSGKFSYGCATYVV